jgi:hypothetical protein
MGQRRIPVRVARIEEASIQGHPAAADVELEEVQVGFDGGHDASFAVADPERDVVLPNQHAIAGGETTAPQLELGAAQLPGAAHAVACALVEVGHVGPAQRDHDGAVGVAQPPPVVRYP